MTHKKKYHLILIAAVFIAAGFLTVNSGIAQKINLNPIKPAANQPLTDEQQGILAVRTVKASVVDILGVSTSTAVNLDDSAPTIQSQPQGDKGTGFVINADGLIVTNNHVVEDPGLQYTVMFNDGSEYPAKILGHDKYDDVALLKIDASNLPVAKLGDSGSLETGQSVFAIGNTLGRYQNTVTRGVVSGLGRSVDSADTSSGPQPRMEGLIQTDAAINPGNSGGPLINLAGEVVGMNTLIDTEGEALGFAIPINTIKDVVHQLQTFGKASRPYLGVQFITLSQFVIPPSSVKVSQGAYVSSVAAGSPADAAGLKAGDVIVAVNGQKLNALNELDTALAQYSAGQQILLTYIRDGQSYDAVVILGEFQ